MTMVYNNPYDPYNQLDVVTAAGVLKLDGLTGRFIHHFPIPPYSPSNIPNKLVPYVLGSVNAHLKTKGE